MSDLRLRPDGEWSPDGGAYFPPGTRIGGSLVNGEFVPLPDETNPKDLIGITKSRLDLVPPALAISAAPAMELGARKYGPYNWRTKAVRLTVYLGAIERHVAAYKDGQDTDPESGYSHLGHAAACLAIIADAKAIGKLIDDRPPAGGAAAMLEEQVATD